MPHFRLMEYLEKSTCQCIRWGRAGNLAPMHALPEPPVPPAPAAGLRIGAVLLAAGAASRMGHRPKCLLEREGRPLVRRQLDALAAAGVAPVVVVAAGAGASRIVKPPLAFDEARLRKI